MYQLDKLESNGLCHLAAQLNTQRKEKGFSSNQHYPHSDLSLSHEDRRRNPLLFWQPHLEAKLSLFSGSTKCHSVTPNFSSQLALLTQTLSCHGFFP